MARRKSRTWPVQDAKARFSELLEASITKGPQIVTRRGVEMAVLVPVDQWRRLEETARPTLKELLLSPGDHSGTGPEKAAEIEAWIDLLEKTWNRKSQDFAPRAHGRVMS